MDLLLENKKKNNSQKNQPNWAGPSDDVLPALTLAVIIYSKGLEHDIIYFLSLFQFLC